MNNISLIGLKNKQLMRVSLSAPLINKDRFLIFCDVHVMSDVVKKDDPNLYYMNYQLLTVGRGYSFRRNLGKLKPNNHAIPQIFAQILV